jgi:hypothetical protein
LKKTYAYSVSGTAAKNQTWEAVGEVTCEFNNVFDLVMGRTFQMLTDGRAVYGKPGLGCSGPYSIMRVVIDQIVMSS